MRCVWRGADKTLSPVKPHAAPRCPRHLCHTCAAADPKQAHKGRLLTCLRCPTAYHLSEKCVPAGCELMNRDFVICPLHFDPKQAAFSQYHLNVDWCFDCQLGGELVCCEHCPAAYHAKCLQMNEMPETGWSCEDCRAGKFPLFRQIVWAKLGAYRWWPAEVLHPLDIPDNIEAMRHSVGEFALKFLGSGDYGYLSRGRVFAFCEGDTGGRNKGGTKSVVHKFSLALKEATKRLNAKKAAARIEELDQKMELANGNPAYYKEIRSNRMAEKGLSKTQLPPDEYPVCGCDPSSEHPCGDDNTCSNRAMQIECHPQLCAAGERCENHRFQQRRYAETQIFRTENRGWGLRALNPLPPGTFVCEYAGEVISQKTFRERWKKKTLENDCEFYFLTLDKDRIIDAGPAGNIGRYMNHSCEPNCTALIWQAWDDIKIGLFTLRPVEAGDELTFHYNLDSLDAEVKLPCSCGGASCLGYIGKRQRVTAPNGNGKKAANGNGKPKKQRKRPPRYESCCWHCGEGGDLICCDRIGCPKVYHLDCIGETTVPKGLFYCPWHYCDDCQKAASKLCHKCPTAYCQLHGEGVIARSETGAWECPDHKPEQDVTEQETGKSVETVDAIAEERDTGNIGEILITSTESGAGEWPDHKPEQETEKCMEKIGSIAEEGEAGTTDETRITGTETGAWECPEHNPEQNITEQETEECMEKVEVIVEERDTGTSGEMRIEIEDGNVEEVAEEETETGELESETFLDQSGNDVEMRRQSVAVLEDILDKIEDSHATIS